MSFFTQYFLFLFLYILNKTLRYKFVGFDSFEQSKKIHPQGSILVASWHQNTLLGITALSKHNFSLLVSPSSDGDLVTYVAQKMGMKSFRGSSSRGGVRALLELCKVLKEGKRIALAVDGPRGPALEPKQGILYLSQKTGTPILPMACVASRYWVLHKTWDGFRIPKPFSTVTVSFAPSFVVLEGKYELGKASEELKDLLNGLESQ